MFNIRSVAISIATAAGLAFATPAALADGYQGAKGGYKPAPAYGRYNWSGLYVGAHVGGTWGDYRLSGDAGAFDENALERYSLEPSNVSFGAYWGVNHQMGILVVGLESDFSFVGGYERIIEFASPDNHVEARIGMHGSFVGRLGIDAGRWMPYVKGGLAWTTLSVLAGDLVDGTLNLDASDTTFRRGRILTGWTVGGGVEYALTNNWILRAEYNYMDFGSFTTTNGDNDVFGHDLIVHNARIGISYKIGRDHDGPLK